MPGKRDPHELVLNKTDFDELTEKIPDAVTKRALAEKLGVSPPVLSEYRHRKRYLNGRFIAACMLLLPGVPTQRYTSPVPADYLKRARS